MDALSIKTRLFGNPYVGRGIIIGATRDGKRAAVGYFIMGRSAGSRARVFVEHGRELGIHHFDPSRALDPSLVVYSPIREFENKLIVTNGDQTDTIYDFLSNGKTFERALDTREYEPDPPHFTPRISGIINFADDSFMYKLNILKELRGGCLRQTFAYPATPGLGHFIHTYLTDGNPLPPFEGEPELVEIGDDIDEFTDEIWNNLDANNRVSLYTRFVDPRAGEYEKRLINRHGEV